MSVDRLHKTGANHLRTLLEKAILTFQPQINALDRSVVESGLAGKHLFNITL